MVCLTKGEAGPTGGLVERDELGETRAVELAKVAEILGADKLELFDFPDSGLSGISLDTLKSLALEMIQRSINLIMSSAMIAGWVYMGILIIEKFPGPWKRYFWNTEENQVFR
jgi:hypothetical protein